MRSRPIVVTNVTFQDSTQVPFVDDDHVVQTFSAKTSDKTFRIAVLPRTPRRCWHLPDAQSVHLCCETVTIDPIAVSHQVSRHGFLRKRLHDLLCRPIGCGVLRYIEMQNTATVVRQDDKYIQHPKLDRRHRE